MDDFLHVGPVPRVGFFLDLDVLRRQTNDPTEIRAVVCVSRGVSVDEKKKFSGGAMREVNGVPRAKQKKEAEKIRRE